MAHGDLYFVADFQSRILPELRLNPVGATFIREFISSESKGVDIIELAASCKFWSTEETLPVEAHELFVKAWKNAVLGHMVRHFCDSILFPSLSMDILETIRIRRDIEAPLVLTDTNRAIHIADQGGKYTTIWNMFRVWLGKEGNASLEMTSDYLIHYLFVTAPCSYMNPLQADYDLVIRFLRALYSVAVQSRQAEKDINQYLISPMNEYYATRATALKLWHFSRSITNNAAIQRCLMGQHNRGNDIDKPAEYLYK
jgi:hypothetical protein